MVRVVHTNNFHEIYLQISDPKIEFLTKTHFLKNGHVQNFRKLSFCPKKKTCGVIPQQNNGVNTFPTIPDPIRTKFYPKTAIFIAKLLKIEDFQ